MPDRPSGWLAGAGVGLCLVSLYGLLSLVVALPVTAWALAAVFGLGLGGTVALDFGVVLVVLWRDAQAALAAGKARTAALEAETERKLAELDAALTVPTDTDDTPRRATAAMVLRWFRAGDAVGFALDSMTAAGVVTQSTWQRLKDFYLCWPEGGPVLVDRGGNVGTVWGPTWTLGRVGDEIALGDLPLPPGAPPDVGVFVPQYNANGQKNTKKARAGAVVEGVVSDRR